MFLYRTYLILYMVFAYPMYVFSSAPNISDQKVLTHREDKQPKKKFWTNTKLFFASVAGAVASIAIVGFASKQYMDTTYDNFTKELYKVDTLDDAELIAFNPKWYKIAFSTKGKEIQEAWLKDKLKLLKKDLDAESLKNTGTVFPIPIQESGLHDKNWNGKTAFKEAFDRDISLITISRMIDLDIVKGPGKYKEGLLKVINSKINYLENKLLQAPPEEKTKLQHQINNLETIEKFVSQKKFIRTFA